MFTKFSKQKIACNWQRRVLIYQSALFIVYFIEKRRSAAIREWYERLLRKEETTMDLVKALSEQYEKPELPVMNVGDTVRVTVRVKEGNRERNQAFEGTIIAKKHGGINETITVRRISYNVGCEKVFPVHSPSIVSVETIRRGKVRRAKLYYLRDRIGKKAKVKEKL